MLSRQILIISQTFAIVLFASGYATHATAAEPCKAAIGQWNWFIGGKVALAENGDARWTPAVASMAPAMGTWRCDPQTSSYIVTWQNGFIDTLTLSADGSKLSGTSSTGAAVSGWRGVAPAAAPAATRRRNWFRQAPKAVGFPVAIARRKKAQNRSRDGSRRAA